MLPDFSPNKYTKRNSDIQNISKIARVSLFQSIKGTDFLHPGMSITSSSRINTKKRLSFQNELTDGSNNNSNSHYNAHSPSNHSCNVKTFLRFRPNNQMEEELNSTNLG